MSIAESVKASDKTMILASPVSLAQLLMLSDKTKTLACPIGMVKRYHMEFFANLLDKHVTSTLVSLNMASYNC